MAETSVTIRMYNVGFGDSFLVTVAQGALVWRMLVDCGVHSHGHVKVGGSSRPIADIVHAIVTELEEQAPAGRPPHLDVIVATHHHADHISGFASDEWERVDVGEVWVPFVEDPDDPDAHRIRTGLDDAADALRGLIEQAAGDVDRGAWRGTLQLAHDFALNSRGNAAATDRLLGRAGKGFQRPPGGVTVRYLPSADAEANDIPTTIPGVSAHILGPSRDPERLGRMDPPASVAWLQLAAEQKGAQQENDGLFDPIYRVEEAEIGERIPDSFVAARDGMALGQLADDTDELLAASSLLERSVNNTSVFFVLDVAGARFLFVGDAQQGAWEHVLDDDRSSALVKDVAFYKIGHHGSHNSTPKRFVADSLGNGATAMLPWGLVKAWRDSIPKRELLEALVQKQTRIVRADDPVGEGVSVGPDLLWSEVTFTVP